MLMIRCVECGTKLEAILSEGKIIDCPECGTELERIGDRIIGLQLGPSEE